MWASLTNNSVLSVDFPYFIVPAAELRGEGDQKGWPALPELRPNTGRGGRGNSIHNGDLAVGSRFIGLMERAFLFFLNSHSTFFFFIFGYHTCKACKYWFVFMSFDNIKLHIPLHFILWSKMMKQNQVCLYHFSYITLWNDHSPYITNQSYKFKRF